MRRPHLWSHPPSLPGSFPNYIHLTTKPLLSQDWIPSGYEGQWTSEKYIYKKQACGAKKSIRKPPFVCFNSALCSPVNSHPSRWKLVVFCACLTSQCWCVCLLHELMCNNSYHFPLCLGRHAGVTVHQRLGWLWERVGDAVAETLAQASSVGRTKCIIFIVPAAEP